MLAQYVTEFRLFYFDKISTFMSVCFVIFILVFVFFGGGVGSVVFRVYILL